MTGLEKIIEKIEDNGRIACEEIISKAEAQAQAILDKARDISEKAKLDAINAANEKSKKDIELARSKAEHEAKKTLLASKISIISDVIDEAMKKLKGLPDDEYFETITKTDQWSKCAIVIITTTGPCSCPESIF